MLKMLCLHAPATARDCRPSWSEEQTKPSRLRMAPKVPQTKEMPPPGQKERHWVVKNIFKVTASQPTSLHFKCECVYAIRFRFQAFHSPERKRASERESNSVPLQSGVVVMVTGERKKWVVVRAGSQDSQAKQKKKKNRQEKNVISGQCFFMPRSKS